VGSSRWPGSLGPVAAVRWLAGNAWEIGIIAGLAEVGFDMTEAADLVVGTSAGATAAAQVRSGMPTNVVSGRFEAAKRYAAEPNVGVRMPGCYVRCSR
jgi:hypothetical protein